MTEEYKDGARIYPDVVAESLRIQQRTARLAKESQQHDEKVRRENETGKRLND
jgi:hypothetical protein